MALHPSLGAVEYGREEQRIEWEIKQRQQEK
jgi:hypothetical protein